MGGTFENTDKEIELNDNTLIFSSDKRKNSVEQITQKIE